MVNSAHLKRKSNTPINVAVDLKLDMSSGFSFNRMLLDCAKSPATLALAFNLSNISATYAGFIDFVLSPIVFNTTVAKCL